MKSVPRPTPATPEGPDEEAAPRPRPQKAAPAGRPAARDAGADADEPSGGPPEGGDEDEAGDLDDQGERPRRRKAGGPLRRVSPALLWGGIGGGVVLASAIVLVVLFSRSAPSGGADKGGQEERPKDGQRGGYLDERRERAEFALKTLSNELDGSDPNWRLDQIEAARARVPDEHNSAPRVLAARRSLPKEWPRGPAYPFEGLSPVAPLSAERARALEQELAGLAEALAEARALAELPAGRFPLTFERVTINTKLEHLQSVRAVNSLLTRDAGLWLQRGEAPKALRSCRAALNAGRSVGDEPTAVSQLVRIACVTHALDAFERVLAQTEIEPRELAEWQRLLAEEERHPAFLIAARGERAMLHALLDGLGKGEIGLDELGDKELGRKDQPAALYRLVIREDHQRLFPSMALCVEAARAAEHHREALMTHFHAEMVALPDGPVKRLVPALNKLEPATRRLTARLRSLNACVAAERYRHERGAWPASLAGLVPVYLPAPPRDPFEDAPLKLRRLPDGLVIYSVGVNKVDNGGAIRPTAPGELPVDFGCQIWDVSVRPQPRRERP
jgi:hypothetical protein